MRTHSRVTVLHVGKLVTMEREGLCVVHSLSPLEAIIRASLPLSPGQSVTLGLRNGSSVPATVGIVHGEQIALLFEEAISTSAILAEQRTDRTEREAIRLAITVPVSVLTLDGPRDCLMQDISLSGMKLLDEAHLLPEGAEAQVVIDGLGKRDVLVRWRQHPFVGVGFQVALGFKLLDQWATQRTL